MCKKTFISKLEVKKVREINFTNLTYFHPF